MLEFQAKRRAQRLLYSTGSIVLLLLLIGFLVKSVVGAYDKKRRSDIELARTQLAYENLTKERESLSRNVVFLKTEEGIDAELRSKYRLVRPGEAVAVIVDDDMASVAPVAAGIDPDSTSTASVLVSSNGLWSRILNFFNF